MENEEPIMEDADETFEPEEDKIATNAEALKPKPPTKFAPRGIETFHWLTPVPRGSIAIFESLNDFKKVHINPHPDNKTIITWSDGRQEEF